MSVRSPRQWFVPGAVALLIAGIASLSPAVAADPPEPMALTKIMQDLGTDMQGITGAMAREDWATVARLADRVAEHPEPPILEKARILMFVGTKAPRFRGYDQQAHAAALELAKAAREQNGTAAIAAFAKVQTGCLGCHQNFRKPFQAHFHGQQ